MLDILCRYSTLFRTMSTALVSRLKSQLDAAKASRKSALQRAKEAGDQAQEMLLTASGAFAGPYLATKFFTPQGGGEPKLLGMPATATLGAIAFGVGMMSDSTPIANIGKGALYAAAAEIGVKAAKP